MYTTSMIDILTDVYKKLIYTFVGPLRCPLQGNGQLRSAIAPGNGTGRTSCRGVADLLSTSNRSDSLGS